MIDETKKGLPVAAPESEDRVPSKRDVADALGRHFVQGIVQIEAKKLELRIERARARAAEIELEKLRAPLDHDADRSRVHAAVGLVLVALVALVGLAVSGHGEDAKTLGSLAGLVLGGAGGAVLWQQRTKK